MAEHFLRSACDEGAKQQQRFYETLLSIIDYVNIITPVHVIEKAIIN